MSDAAPIKGEFIFDFIAEFGEYWGLTIGNHDIEHFKSVLYLVKNFVPKWNGNYVTSNTFLKSSRQPIGNPFKVIESQTGSKILMLGYLFDFKIVSDFAFFFPPPNIIN